MTHDQIMEDVSNLMSFCFVTTERINIAGALVMVSHSIDRLADAVNRLGLNEADVRLGAIELLSREVRDGFRLMRNEK